MSIIKKLFALLLIAFCGWLCSCNSNSKNKKTNPSVNIKNNRTDTIKDVFQKKYKYHLILNAVLNGNVKVRLIYDTGNPYNLFLDSSFVVKNNWFEKLKLRQGETGKMSLVQYIKNIKNLKQKHIKISIGGIEKDLTQTYVGNLYKVIKDEAEGLIGNKFMESYLVEIDYQKNYLVLHKPNAKIDFKDFAFIPFKYNGFMWIDVLYLLHNGNSFKQVAAIDLGDGTNAVSIQDNRLINKFDILNQITNKVEKKRITTMYGNNIKVIAGNIKAIELAKTLIIDTPKVGLQINENPKERKSSGYMLIGNYVFKKFGKIFIDYQNKKIYVPNESLKNNIRLLN